MQRTAASAAIMAALRFLTAACAVAAIRSVHWRAASLLLQDAAKHAAHNGMQITWSVLKAAALQLMAMHVALAAGAGSNPQPQKEPQQATAAPPAAADEPQLQSGDAAAGTADGGTAAGQNPGDTSTAAGGLLSTALPRWAWALFAVNCGLAALVDVMDIDGGITAWAIRLLVQDAAAHIMRHGASFFYGVACGAWLLHYRHTALRTAEGL